MNQGIFILVMLWTTSLAGFWHNFFPGSPLIQPQKPSRQATIMLAPFGNSSMQGRPLKSNFEFTIAHDFVHALKQEIVARFPDTRVRISHKRTEIVQPVQLANAANCLSVDCLLSFQFYLETEDHPHVTLYQCSYGNDFMSKRWDLSWCRSNEAYLINKKCASTWADTMITILQDEQYSQWFTATGPYKIPLKLMLGIIPPAFFLEIGLKEDDEWKQFVAPIVDCLQPIIREIINTVKQETL